MTLRMHNALKSTIALLQASCKAGILVYGVDNINQKTFCQPISLAKAAKKLLSCQGIEIRGIGYYKEAEEKMVNWIKQNIRLPTNAIWANIASPHNWLRYSVAPDLSCLKLSRGKIDYYLILREEHLSHFRRCAFGKKS